MNTIRLDSNNYRDYLPLDIAAFDFAFSGAMGDPGGVHIITRNGDTYYFNHACGDLEWSQVEKIIPVISQSRLPIVEDTKDVPAGWRHIGLGMGNNLLIKEEYAEPLNREWEKYLKTTDNEYPLLYGVWHKDSKGEPETGIARTATCLPCRRWRKCWLKCEKSEKVRGKNISG